MAENEVGGRNFPSNSEPSPTGRQFLQGGGLDPGAGETVQVVVLAGGFGTRLRPWTNRVPKPLLPMLDLTLVERVVEALPVELVDEVLIAAGFGIEQMREHFAGVETPYQITIIEESEPLGTGGAIRNCRAHLRDETFCVMNGDLLSSVPVGEMLDFHRSQGGLATISLWEVEDPTRFGVCDIKNDGRVYQFQEKPTLEEACSNMINAGCYILEPEVFDRMPEGPHSMERVVYTPIASEGLLNGFPFTGHFVDAGTPTSWLEAMAICLVDERWDSGGSVGNSSWGGDGASIDGEVNGSAIGEGAQIGDSAKIRGCSVLAGARVSAGAELTGCLVGEDAAVGEGAILRDVVIDFNAEVPAGHEQQGGVYPPTD
uniref:Bifunctional protein GlmU n=1 Tax=uncultured marine group II/III euryarchaeote KM3_92_B07 TaxID=1456543 RepID=A0A075I440_9EURY|nr:translation initiation factor eIF2B subunit (GMPP) [uncultured marine group II/III euryarchaeote KM3_92_B07]